MKYADRLRAGIDNVRDYATSERVKRHGAVASAIGKTCSALLEVVTEENHPQAHKVIRGIGNVASVAAIASNTTAEIADIFKAPEAATIATDAAQAELPAEHAPAAAANVQGQVAVPEVQPLPASPAA